MTDVSDAQLLERFVRGRSEDAFAELVQRHIALVYSVALRHTANPQHAEDITQAVFIVLARKAGTLGHKTALPGWLYHTARLTAANLRRTEARRWRREQEACMQSELEESSTDSMWRDLSPHLDEAMAGLGASERDALVLRYFQNRSMAEVSQYLGVAENTAQKRVGRAVEKLRKFFAKRGVVLSSTGIVETISAHSMQVAPAALAKTVTAVALAKSAVASTSTLTLAKIMALTKTKTTVAVAVITLLGVTLLTMKAVHASRTARLNALHDIQGTWEGDRARGSAGVNRDLPARNRMVLRISKNNGDYTATADLIDWGRKDVPVTVDYRYPSLHLSINPWVIMDGTVNTDASKLDFHEFTLERTNAADLVPEALTEAEFAPRAGSDLQGYWKGTIDTKPSPLPLNLKIAESADGTIRAEVDNPIQGARSQSATVIYRRPTLQLMLNSRDGMLQAEVNGDNSEIKGSWLEPKRTISARFKRADFNAEHAQDTVKNYTFHSADDLQGHWEGSFLIRKEPANILILLDLDIAKLPDGAFSATVVSVYNLSNGDPRIPLDFQYTAPNLRIAWMSERFEGQMKNGKLVGHWINGNKAWSIVFTRKSK